ncbi:MAG: alpha/beta hydrolase [Chloroflexi bacterium]|nr:alpha/beta hydrolase [Chloroflexota bacterium]
MANWRSYTLARKEHTVVGELLITDDVHSPQRDNRRSVLVWLPPTYRLSERRYPVIYMHDGDNLFDAHGSYAGEWGVDETLTALAPGGIEAIVVGLPNMGEQRFLEYNPFGGAGEDYIRFIVDTVKPMIDDEFRTLRDAAHTCIAGSSMGGLISLFGYLRFPEVFRLCGAFSPVFWLEHDALVQMVLAETAEPGRVYLDVGGKEGDVIMRLAPEMFPTLDDAHNAYRDGVRQLRDGFKQNGYGKNLLYLEDPNAAHNEPAWAARLPSALRFLLG